MRDDNFEPRLGRLRAPGSPRGRRYLHAVLAAAARQGSARRGAGRTFEGSRLGRGAVSARLLASRGRPSSALARRAIVKTRLVRLSGRSVGGMRAHLRYLQRDGTSRDGAPGGMYAADRDTADGKDFLERCAADRHQFRIIVSAEDGSQYEDLKPLIRRFMARMEDDLGTALDWVAVDHVDTLHPHSHILLRGRDDRDQNLVIAPAYIARGMRERVSELVSLDLGPRSDREVAANLRRDVTAERFTPLDRRLMRDADRDGRIIATSRDLAEHSLRIGRLRKLEHLGLASRSQDGRWKLAPDLESALRALGERGDIIRTMQRALGSAESSRLAADYFIHDPAAGALIGRVTARGLADELRDRHFLLVDGVDGRLHYVDVGHGASLETLGEGAIVRITAATGRVRAVDRTIAAVADANQGRYSAALHLAHDPSATSAFAEAHVRRLEAMRRPLSLARDGEGVWTIPIDHLRNVERVQARSVRQRLVRVELLSPQPLEQLADKAAATWLDRQLAADEPLAVRDAGFGREVGAALAARRAWLIEQHLADDQKGRLQLRRGALALLLRRELLGAAEALASESDKDYLDATDGLRVEGIVRRRVDLASGRFALIDSERSFTLVPWRPIHERALGQHIAGTIRERGTSWSIGRSRGLER